MHLIMTLCICVAISFASAQAGSVQFSEDFNDGNYDGWTYSHGWSYSKGTINTHASTGKWYVYRSGGGGAHGWVRLEQTLDIPVVDDTYIEFDIHAISSSVRNYTGDGNGEFPANVELTLDTPAGDYTLRFAYSEDNASKPDRSGSDWYQVTNMNSGYWKRDERYNIRDYVPTATRITKIDLFSNGWSFTGEWDNIEIVSDSAAVPGPLAIFGGLGLLGYTARRRRNR